MLRLCLHTVMGHMGLTAVYSSILFAIMCVGAAAMVIVARNPGACRAVPDPGFF